MAMEKKQMENLLRACEIALSNDSFHVYAPDLATANQLAKYWWRVLAQEALSLKKRDTKVFCPELKRPFQVAASMVCGQESILQSGGTQFPDKQNALSSSALLSLDEQVPTLQQLSTATDEDLHRAVLSARVSACITTVADNKIVAANFAVVPSHGKPFHQMIGSDLTPLWDADELSRVMSYLDRDGYAHNLEYWTWKWDLQPDGAYTRIRQHLNRNAFAVMFDGVPCRLTVGKF